MPTELDKLYTQIFCAAVTGFAAQQAVGGGGYTVEYVLAEAKRLADIAIFEPPYEALWNEYETPDESPVAAVP